MGKHWYRADHSNKTLTHTDKLQLFKMLRLSVL